MERITRREERPARSRRLRSALLSSLFLSVAAAACTFWVGLALPGMQLLPGIGLADRSVSISLQSALLGIDDTTGRPSYAFLSARARSLGLTPTQQLLAADLLRVRAASGGASLIAQIDPRALAPTEVAAGPAPLRPEPGRVPLESSPSAPVPAPTPSAPAPPHPPATTHPTAPPVVPAPPLSQPPLSPPPVVATQTIVFTSAPPANAVAGLGTYIVSAKASSGLPVALSIDASSLGACAISGATVVFVGAGTCRIDADQSGNASFRAAPRAQQAFTISSVVVSHGRSLQTINFATSPPAGAAVGAWYAVVATASSGLPVALWADAGSTGTCTVSGSSVHFVGAGTCTVQAGQSGNGDYDAAPVVQQSFSVGLTGQTISFTSVPPAGAVVGLTTYTVAAAATSGLAVVFAPDPASAGVCTVSGSTVTPVGAGTCTIDANQFGDGTYQGAPQVQQSFSVGSGTPSLSVQSINFTSTAPSSATIGASYSIGATSSSGLPVVFSAAASSAGVCTVSGATVSFAGVGTCTVDADQAGNGSYLPAPQVHQSFAIGKAPQTLSFSTLPPSGAVVGGATYSVAATASSGLAAAFSADASSAGVCSVAGSTVSFTGAGTCTVDADQAGNATFAAAAQIQQSFTVSTPSLSIQSIAFTSPPPVGANAGGGPYIVAATASSGLPVAFSADASSAGVCTVSGSSVTLVGAGTCTVDANQPGNGSYQAAAQMQQSFAVGTASQTIAFTSAPPSPAGVGDPDYAVAASATSGLAVVFSADAASAGICTVSGASVALVGAGTCIVDANQAGDATHQAAPQAQQSFSIGGPPAPSVQSISFTSSAPAGAVAGGGAYTVTATASSGLAVAFSADASSAGVCTVSGSTVSFAGSGTCTVDANQAGNGSYQAAPQMQQAFAVGKTTQTIGFTSTPPAGAAPGGTAYTVTATASSGLVVAFTLSAGSAGVCSISGATVSFVAAGTCTINANQAGNGTYQAAPQAQQSFTVAAPPAPSPQTINVTSSPPPGAVIGGMYTIAATASSGLAVTFSADATSAGICTVSGSTVSFTGHGNCTVNADQAGNANYLAAPRKQQTFPIGVAAQNISFTSSPPGSAVVGGSTYTVTATATSGLAVVFSADPASAGICTVSGSTVTPIGAGQCRVAANQAGNGNYAAASQVEQTFTISKASQTISITWTPPNNIHKKDGPYTITATATSGLGIVFTTDPSSNGVCSVSGSTVTIIDKGTCTVYANQPGNSSWLPAPQTQVSFQVK